MTGTTELISTGFGEGVEIGMSMNPAISADGRFVVFTSQVANLTAGDTQGSLGLFVRDRQTSSTERITVPAADIQEETAGYVSAISADGRYVAFTISLTDPWHYTPSKCDVYLHDRHTGVTMHVGTGAMGDVVISTDGRFLAFTSMATLVQDDTNDKADVFLYDRQTGITERISVATDGTEANNYSFFPAISADGRYVVFFWKPTTWRLGLFSVDLTPSCATGRQGSRNPCGPTPGQLCRSTGMHIARS